MKKFSTRILFLFAVLAFLALAGCTGNTGVTPPAPSATTVPLSKYTVTGVAPGASITASPSNPFTSQVSVTPFGLATAVNLITIAKNTTTGTPTFTETISTSSPAAYPSYQTITRPSQLQLAQSSDPFVAEQAVRAREQQLMTSVNPATARSAFQQQRMQALMAPNAVATASVGATATFNVYNFTTAGNQVVNATCQYMGTNAYIFVDNTIIGGAGTTYASGSAQLAAISTAFDAIYTTDRATFGSEWNPGIDNDPKIYILISPAVNTNGTNGILGYFYGGDEYPKALVPLSNQHEMFYVVNKQAGAPTDLWADANTATPANATIGYNILAHEFQHMINFNTKFGHNGLYNGVIEDTWLNEGLSMYAMQACGYGLTNTANGGLYPDTTTRTHVINYLSLPELFSLTNWTSANYGISYLFVLYLVEHYPSGTPGVGSAQSQAMLQAMESNGSVGIANVETQTGAGTFGTVFKNWAMANLLDHVTNNATYGYTSINLHGTYGAITLPGIVPFSYSTYPQNLSGTQPGWSAYYQRFTGGTNNALNINIMSSTSVNNLEGIVVVQ